jgi:pimeloyl-ACP methyl ester carboxylesterase
MIPLDTNHDVAGDGARTGFVTSGDVDLFYRLNGEKGQTPIMLLHGANYYDSQDWIEIAAELARQREVLAWDQRGFGRSDRSRIRNYAFSSDLADLSNLLDHFGWPKAVLVGHSAGGLKALLAASRLNDRVAGLVLVDHCPGVLPRSGMTQSLPDKTYPTAEAAHSDTSRDPVRLDRESEIERWNAALIAVPGGYKLRRDPDLRVPADDMPDVEDTWMELRRVACPTLIVYGTKSNRYSSESLARIADEFPEVEKAPVESGHDVLAGAPEKLSQAIADFVARRIDQ